MSWPSTARALPERPPGVGGDDPDPGQPPWTTHELVACDVGERGGNDLRRGGVRQAEWSGHVLAVDDDVHQGVHRRAPRGPAPRLGARPQLGNEFGGRVAGRATGGEVDLHPVEAAPGTDCGHQHLRNAQPGGEPQVGDQVPDGPGFAQGLRRPLRVVEVGHESGKGEPLGTDGGLDGGTCEDRVGSEGSRRSDCRTGPNSASVSAGCQPDRTHRWSSSEWSSSERSEWTDETGAGRRKWPHPEDLRAQTTLMTTVLPLGALLPPDGSVLTTYCTPM